MKIVLVLPNYFLCRGFNLRNFVEKYSNSYEEFLQEITINIFCLFLISASSKALILKDSISVKHVWGLTNKMLLG